MASTSNRAEVGVVSPSLILPPLRGTARAPHLGRDGLGVTLVATAHESLFLGSRISTDIASAVEEQGAVTNEIARTRVETSRGSRLGSVTVACVAQAADTANSGSEQVFSAAGDLARQAQALRSEIGSFLATVRAA